MNAGELSFDEGTGDAQGAVVDKDKYQSKVLDICGFQSPTAPVGDGDNMCPTGSATADTCTNYGTAGSGSERVYTTSFASLVFLNSIIWMVSHL